MVMRLWETHLKMDDNPVAPFTGGVFETVLLILFLIEETEEI